MDDVHEAHRLIASAMHKAYIDPKTGKIDMDLISTGISQRQRNELAEIGNRVMAFLELTDKPSIRFFELLAKLNENGRIDENELEQVLGTFAVEQVIGLTGRSKNEMIITSMK